MAIIIKNVDSVAHTYSGQTIGAGSQYTVQSTERFRFANDDDLIADIVSGLAVINDGISDIIGSNAQINHLKEYEPKNLDGRSIVHSTPRKIGLVTCFTGSGDEQTNEGTIYGASAQLMELHHQIGDPVSQSIYLPFKTIANETMAHSGHMMWKGALNDIVTLETVPKLSTYSASTGTNFNIYGGYLVVPAAGDGLANMTAMHLVEMPVNEFGVRAAGYWNADYNSTTKLFENITPNLTATGRFNMFVAEVVFDRFINRMPLLGDGFMHLDTYDASQIGHNMQIKLTLETRGTDHDWWWCGGLKPYRKKTV